MPSQVDLLHQTSKIVSSGLTLDEMLRELIRLAVQVTACDACLIYLAEPEGDVVLRASQLPHTDEIGHIRIKLGEGVTGWVAEHKSAVALASKAAADKRFKKFPALIEDTYEAFLSVPLVSGGDVIGVINVHHKERAPAHARGNFADGIYGRTDWRGHREVAVVRRERAPSGRDAGNEAPARNPQAGGTRQRHPAIQIQAKRGGGVPAAAEREPAVAAAHARSG